MLLTLGIVLALGFVGSLLPATIDEVQSEQSFSQVLVVKDPVASVYTEPQELTGKIVYPAFRTPIAQNDISLKTQDTQLVYGERVVAIDQPNEKGMVRVLVLAQQPATSAVFNAQQNAVVQFLEGYMHQRHLVPELTIDNAMIAVTQSLSTVVKAEANNHSATLMDLPFGSVVVTPVDQAIDGYQQIVLGDGRTGFIDFSTSEALIFTPDIGNIATLRQIICENAKKFLGMPFCWGGRSPFIGTINPQAVSDYQVPTSVDASGLVSLVMHSGGLMVPRNSADQAQCATSIEPAAMQPGDLIFLKSFAKDKINYVAMYLGNNEVIAARGSLGLDSKVAIATVEKLFGAPLEQLTNGKKIFFDGDDKACEMYCGSFLVDQEKAQQLRQAWLIF